MLAEILAPITTKNGMLAPGEIIDAPFTTIKRLSTKVRPISEEPEWQHNFCTAHADFNNWRGCCPCSIDDCLGSKIIDSDGDINRLRGLEIGCGITTDMVIDAWLDTGEPVGDFFKNPAWLICMAEHIRKHKGEDYDVKIT